MGGQIGTASGPYIASLTEMLDGPHQEQLRPWILEALGNIGEAALPVANRIVELLATSSVVEERAAAATALGKMGDVAAKKYAPHIVPLLSEADANLREAAVYAFDNFGGSA